MLGTFADVALFTGAWIEMPISRDWEWVNNVALFTGAWIEIKKMA